MDAYKYFMLPIDDEDDELNHHGVKGMKWGVRKQRKSSGNRILRSLAKRMKSSVGGVKKATSVHKKKKVATKLVNKKKKQLALHKKKLANKSIDELSDDELKTRTARLKLEKEYLTAKNDVKNLSQKKKSAGKMFVDSVLAPAASTASRDAATTLLRSVGNAAVESLLKSAGIPVVHDKKTKITRAGDTKKYDTDDDNGDGNSDRSSESASYTDLAKTIISSMLDDKD